MILEPAFMNFEPANMILQTATTIFEPASMILQPANRNVKPNRPSRHLATRVLQKGGYSHQFKGQFVFGKYSF